MKIAFTLCSNNYLAQAKTLGDSLLQHNPDYRFIIGLVDELHPEIDYTFFSRFDIIPVVEVIGERLEELWKKFDIIELNTCVKPIFFMHLFSTHPDSQIIYYLDPDTMVFNTLEEISLEFDERNNILLTPHINTPIPLDGSFPGENLFLNYGIYNLGFLGLKRSKEVETFLSWWNERTLNLGFSNPSEGLFVDQLWINLVPIFFNAKILLHEGCNMAPWNLHERNLNLENDSVLVNNARNLIFYHFSTFSYKTPTKLSSRYNRYSFQTHPDLVKLYNKYFNKLIENKVEELASLTCFYTLKRRRYLKDEEVKKINSSKINQIRYVLRKLLPDVVIRLYRAI